MKAAVALLIFNRPDLTARVFAAIREARPPVLLVVADGPRETHAGDAVLCLEARRIVERVDWPCEVVRNYSESNLGCRRRVSTGLDWVFSMVEEAVILEDDCQPAFSFFRFCEELLQRYRYDERVLHVGGSNFLFGARPRSESYYFSQYPQIWGWASWRRAWRHYDVELTAWKNAGEQSRDAFLLRFDHTRERAYWRHALEATAAGEIDTWDYQWIFTCMRMNGLAVVLVRNLISNNGFCAQAMHTRGESPLARAHTEDVQFPLTHQISIERDRSADQLTAKVAYRTVSFVGRTLHRIEMLLTPAGREKFVRRLSEEFPGMFPRRTLR
jgi:hypothetical protein